MRSKQAVGPEGADLSWSLRVCEHGAHGQREPVTKAGRATVKGVGDRTPRPQGTAAAEPRQLLRTGVRPQWG